MLVKLGDVWVDPLRVEAMCISDDEKFITITTPGHSFISSKDVDLDNYASIVNSALNQQSFGGESEA